MKIKFAFGLLLLVTALIFSLQNAAVVDVKFLTWRFTTSLALVFFVTLAVGLIGGWAVSGALRLKRGKEKK